jgi:hypothetical protein
VGLGASDYQATSASLTNDVRDGETMNCQIEDSCRVCSFKELQQVAACQETGYRLILKCITQVKYHHEDIGVSFKDEAC